MNCAEQISDEILTEVTGIDMRDPKPLTQRELRELAEALWDRGKEPKK
jgi:hypothetical protein